MLYYNVPAKRETEKSILRTARQLHFQTICVNLCLPKSITAACGNTDGFKAAVKGNNWLLRTQVALFTLLITSLKTGRGWGGEGLSGEKKNICIQIECGTENRTVKTL